MRLSAAEMLRLVRPRLREALGEEAGTSQGAKKGWETRKGGGGGGLSNAAKKNMAAGAVQTKAELELLRRKVPRGGGQTAHPGPEQGYQRWGGDDWNELLPSSKKGGGGRDSRAGGTTFTIGGRPGRGGYPGTKVRNVGSAKTLADATKMARRLGKGHSVHTEPGLKGGNVHSVVKVVGKPGPTWA